jgi:hypothetical protein
MEPQIKLKLHEGAKRLLDEVVISLCLGEVVLAKQEWT